MRWLFAILISCAATGAQADNVDRNLICKDLSQDYIAKHEENRDYRLYRIFEFYSAKLDACIHVEAKLFGTSIEVRDLTGVVFSDHQNMLFHCDVSGIDEANIEVVWSHLGDISEVPYKDWLSDGKGGPPRTLQAPELPLRRSDCEAALERWLVRWNG